MKFDQIKAKAQQALSALEYRLSGRQEKQQELMQLLAYEFYMRAINSGLEIEAEFSSQAEINLQDSRFQGFKVGYVEYLDIRDNDRVRRCFILTPALYEEIPGEPKARVAFLSVIDGPGLDLLLETTESPYLGEMTFKQFAMNFFRAFLFKDENKFIEVEDFLGYLTRSEEKSPLQVEKLVLYSTGLAEKSPQRAKSRSNSSLDHSWGGFPSPVSLEA